MLSLSAKRRPLLAAIAVALVFGWLITSPMSTSTVEWKTPIEVNDMPPEPTPSSHEPAWKNTTRANAAFIILTRNSELDQIRSTMQQLEARFNRKFQYPYVFLNDVAFTEEFKELTQSLTSAKVEYGIIPTEQWSYPDWIDIAKADQVREEMGQEQIIYGDSLSYRHMCRFESGFFFRHPLTLKYDYYWRVEPGVEFFCDLDYDPFLFMQENNKKYGWTISLLEIKETIETLWNTTREFMQNNPALIPKDNLLKFVSNDNGETYNLCHFWSNFEIGDLNFLRNASYMAYFEHLDKAGGFFYERWGDAPIHSIAVAMFLRKDEVHFFNDIGYKHDPLIHCPVNPTLQKKCHCNSEDNFDFQPNSCMENWLSA